MSGVGEKDESLVEGVGSVVARAAGEEEDDHKDRARTDRRVDASRVGWRVDARMLPEDREFIDQRARDARWGAWRDEILNRGR